MKCMMKLRYLFLIVLLISQSCKDKSTSFRYKNNFLKYLEKEQHISFQNDGKEKSYFVIHLQGCENCISTCLDIFINKPTKASEICVIFVGKYIGSNESIKQKLEIVKKQYQFKYDIMQKIFSYQTGFGSPIFAKFRGAKCYRYDLIEQRKIEVKLRKYLS